MENIKISKETFESQVNELGGLHVINQSKSETGLIDTVKFNEGVNALKSLLNDEHLYAEFVKAYEREGFIIEPRQEFKFRVERRLNESMYQS